ncbi:MAG TPA: ATP phosphoribosyltransferase regulatory subunit, partial [Phycisphaerales bacterium]|nr:ATP phosphoribosyltransferase regulatory subunit [Phycisphaerales bacterium]
MPPGQPSQQHVFQAPTGTRDFYPQELLRRRYIEKAWRDVSIRHGFEEIDGPTFEHLDLYTVKSGEGIVSELFSFERAGGEKTYALRPEFTPTLARMYAARASSLPRPTKWFWQQNCFRAERPQRGRLREFLQWNVDVIGGEGVYADELNLEAVAVLVELLSFLGLGAEDIRVKVSDRRVICKSLERHGVASQTQEQFFALLDAREKIGAAEYRQRAHALGLPSAVIAGFDPEDKQVVRFDTDFQGLPAAEREEAVR